MELEFSRLNLKEGDYLIVKVDTSGLTETEAVKKLQEIKNDPFLDFVHKKGHEIFISYTGIDFSILRLNENDKVVITVDTNNMSVYESIKYMDYIKEKVKHILKDEQYIVVSEDKSKLNVLNGDNDGN